MKLYQKSLKTGGSVKEKLTKKDKKIVNDFVRIFKKHKNTTTPLRMAELLGSAIEQTRLY